jgi:hypothetical protein
MNAVRTGASALASTAVKHTALYFMMSIFARNLSRLQYYKTILSRTGRTNSIMGQDTDLHSILSNRITSSNSGSSLRVGPLWCPGVQPNFRLLQVSVVLIEFPVMILAGDGWKIIVRVESTNSCNELFQSALAK